jgi:integrase
MSLGTADVEAALELRQSIMAPVQHWQTGDLAAALRRAADRLNAPQAVTHGVPLTAAWGLFVTSKRRPRSGSTTLRHYRLRWEAFVRWATGQGARLAEQVASEPAERYVAHLESAGLSASTIGTHLQALRLVWRIVLPFAASPWAGVRSQAASRVTPYRRLTLAECRALFAHTSGELRALVVIGYTTGLRLFDAVHLSAGNLDRDRMLLTVAPRKTARLHKLLSIPVLPYVLECLPSGCSDLFMPVLASSYDRVEASVSKTVGAAMRRTGILDTAAGRASFHSLRKTFVSQMDEAGAPGKVTDSITGHGSAGDMHARYSQPDVELARAWMLKALPPLSSS